MSEPTIVGLSGYARSGKDTVGQILVDHHGFRRVSFAERLKAMALDMDPVLVVDTDPEDTTPYRARLSETVELCGGYEKAKDEIPAVREYLQLLGTQARNHLGSDVWVNAAFADVEPGDLIVVTDVRYQNEAQIVKDRGGVVLRVQRPGVAAVNGHASEHDLDGWPFDAVLPNNGSLDKLAVQVGTVLAYLNVPSRRGVRA